jgi:Rieske Fe-S protein
MATAGIALIFVFLWNRLTLQHLRTSAPKQRIFPFNKNRSVAFNGDVIVVNQGDQTTAYSSHCTHLGCKIDKMEGNHFVCPCHGSQYDLNGKVQKGPAFRNLEVLPSTISEDGNTIIIEG